MAKIKIKSCQDLVSSERVAQERLAKAVGVFGEPVVKKIIGLVLYWLGAKRGMIADCLEMPLESLRTFVRVVHRDGLSALEDRRRKYSSFLPVKEKDPKLGAVTVSRAEEQVILDCQGVTSTLCIPEANDLQLRTVVLTLLHSGIINLDSAAETLGVTKAHATVLMKSLLKDDAVVLIDQRSGQKQDYRVDAQMKGELLLQWALNAATGQPTSSGSLSEGLQARCEIKIPERTLRHHMKRLGISQLGGKLTKLVSDVKKGS